MNQVKAWEVNEWNDEHMHCVTWGRQGQMPLESLYIYSYITPNFQCTAIKKSCKATKADKALLKVITVFVKELPIQGMPHGVLQLRNKPKTPKGNFHCSAHLVTHP